MRGRRHRFRPGRPDRRRQRPAQIYAGGARRGGVSRLRPRWWALLLVLGAALVAALVAGSNATEKSAREPAEVVVVRAGRPLLRFDSQRWLGADRARRRKALARVPRHLRRRRQASTITLRVDRRALSRRVTAAARRGGGRVRLPVRAVAASTRLPIVRQRLRNNCETAALEMVLAGQGRRIGQSRLQGELARSEPVDPIGGGTSAMVWGDPDRGFVGRPDGGGPAGGYGVYERPVAALARRHGARPTRSRGARPADVYAELLAGRPVMTWIGLSDGPYVRWRTREGRRVTGNFGEHTVVLTGLRGNRLAVNDPLDGRRKTWTKGKFELMWRRLGRRALSLH